MGKIPVIVPCAPQHIYLLEDCIDGIRRNVTDGVSSICVVTPGRIVNAVKELSLGGVDVVSEEDVVGFSKQDFYGMQQSIGGNWLYQQLIKVCAGTVYNEKKYLTVDADHYLLRPHTFIEEGKTNYYITNDQKIQYKVSADRLLGINVPMYNLCFITEKMLFDTEIVEAMKQSIENNIGMQWHEAIRSVHSISTPFSEFITYANFAFIMRPDSSNKVRTTIKFGFGIPKKDEHTLRNSAERSGNCDSFTLISSIGKFPGV